MKNKKIFIIMIIAIIAILLIVAWIFGKKSTSSIKLETASDLKSMIESVYKNAKVELPSLETTKIELSNNDILSSYTGLKNNDNVEAVVISEPLMSSQAYSLVAIKMKNGTDIESTKQEIYNNVNMAKWVCVSADKLYITNYNNVIFYVMSNEEWAKPVYEAFKEYVGNKTGKELEKTQNYDIELPPERVVQ